jgi:ribosome-associated protein
LIHWQYDTQAGPFMPPAQEPSETTLVLRGDHITLAQALKRSGLAETGGQAKYLVRLGGVTVNGQAETQPGRKLRTGDRFGITGGPEWTITA